MDLRRATDAAPSAMRDPGAMLADPRRTVRVDPDPRGGWDVTVPDRPARWRCNTLDDARRQAFLCAARRLPCELVIQDAYHRVIDREIIEG